MYLYTLALENGHFYVGTTLRPRERLRQHRAGLGAAWTKAHPPLKKQAAAKKLKGCHTMARLAEDFKCKQMMFQHGVDKVRGGSYCSLVLSAAELACIERELRHASGACVLCGAADHWAAQCPSVE